jgi:[ribosomal protein S5]-alanine N-acetyltransferase
MPVLETDRLLLRDFSPRDWEAITTILSDPEVTRYMHFASWNEEKRRAWFDWCIGNSRQPNPDVYNWAISLKDTDSAIGWLGIGRASHPTMEHERDCGYVLDQQFWGQGYMTEALRAVLAYEFEVLGTLRIFATCETANRASARVMEKAGMRYEGTFDDTDSEGNQALRHRYAIHTNEYGSPGEHDRRLGYRAEP